MCKSLEAFKSEILQESEEVTHVAIMLHPNPDPDCMGSACGLKKLLAHWNSDIQCSMVYDGEISHPQNKTMVNILNLSMTHRSKIEDLEKFATHFVTVDVLPERVDINGAKCVMAIDHHRGDTKKAKHKDIRPVGATASIIWEYLQKEGVVLDKTVDDDANVATALLIGIKTDTQELTSDNTTDLDFEAYKSLMNSVNQRKLKSIDKYPIPPYHFELRKRLDQEGNVDSSNGVFIGGIAYISPSKRDALPTIAEERARVEGTDTAFIFAIVGHNIEVSVRSNSLAIDVNAICQAIFGEEHAGGKFGAGAANIPMGFLEIEDDNDEIKEQMWQAIRLKIISKIKATMEDHR